MKVLQINCVWKKGSTGKILLVLKEGFKKRNIETVICYGRGKKFKEDNVYKTSTELGAKVHSLFSRLFGVDFGHSFFATKKLISIIKKEKPNVVHLHCLNAHFVNVYTLLNFLKTSAIPTVLTLHAEIMHTAGCEHAAECEKWKTQCNNCSKIRGVISSCFRDDAKYCYNRMQKAFSGFEDLKIVGVSKWLTDRARESKVFGPDTEFLTIENGIDTQAFTFVDSSALREELNISGDKKIVLHITPNFNHIIKGGKYVLELAKKMPDVQFIILGFNGDKSLLPNNVLPIDKTIDKDLVAKFYSMADVTIVTSLRESFSTVTAESLACGTPVAAFKAGGPETIAIPEYSRFVENGNVDALKQAVEYFLENGKNPVEISKKAAVKYLSEKMVEKYLEIYK